MDGLERTPSSSSNGHSGSCFYCSVRHCSMGSAPQMGPREAPQLPISPSILQEDLRYFPMTTVGVGPEQHRRPKEISKERRRQRHRWCGRSRFMRFPRPRSSCSRCRQKVNAVGEFLLGQKRHADGAHLPRKRCRVRTVGLPATRPSRALSAPTLELHRGGRHDESTRRGPR
jgi:hypothetical protein